MKILFVCLGNICRSPLAEGIFRHINTDIIVDSAGTSNYHIGKSPDARMIDTAKSFDIDISKLSARQFTTDDLDNFDKIFVMDSENYKNVVSLAKDKSQIDKVQYTLSDQKDVPDPYFGGQQGFVRVYEMLYNACQNISDDLK